MAISAHGSEIHMGDGGGPETFTKIPGPTDFELNLPEGEQIDVTNHDSSAREYLAGLGADGDVSFDVQFDAGEPMHINLRDKHNVAQPTNFKIHFPDAENTIATLAATVAVKFQLPVEGAQVMSVTLKISNAVVWS